MTRHPDRANPVFQTLCMILAGGQGERLYPLTRDRAKPAVLFGGNYRLIDFTLSNCLNSGVRRIYVLTQYKSDSLHRHVRLGWNLLNPELDEYVEIRSPQQRLTSHWYQGTADAIYQNIYTLQLLRPRYVLVLSGDHVYRMNYLRLIEQHVANNADLTIACIETPIEEAARLGVISVDVVGRALGFEEKPEVTASLGARDGTALCSMGVYVFKTEMLVRRVIEDAKNSTSHDFGRDVVPAMIQAGDDVFAFKFFHENGGAPYWRDIGTLDAYWEAHMDLVRAEPVFDLYDHRWPVRSYAQSAPPFKTMSGGGEPGLPGSEVRNSLVCNGTIIRDGHVSDSVIGRNVRINCGSRIEESVIMDGVCVGRGVTIRRAVIDKGNHIPDDSTIGVELEQDRTRFTVSEGGVVVVPKNMPLFHPPEAQADGSD